MVNYNDFRPPYQQFGDQYSQRGQTPDERPYRPPKTNNSKFFGDSFNGNQDFVRHGLGFLSQSGQSSFSDSDHTPAKHSKFLKPVKFTRPVGDKYLQLETFLSSTEDPSILTVTTATSTTTDFTKLAAVVTNTDKETFTSIDNKTYAEIDEGPIKTIDEKINTKDNNKDVSKSKDQEEISTDRITEDKVIVEDFVHGKYVDEEELETLLKNEYDKSRQKYSSKVKEKEMRSKNTITTDMGQSPSTSTIGFKEDKDIKEDEVSDSELEVKNIYKKELQSRRKRDQKKAGRELYNGYTNGFHDYSQYSSLQYPTPQYPPTHYPPSNYPPSYYQSSQYPPTQYPHSQYPPSQYPTSRYPSSNYPPPPPQNPHSRYSHPQYPPSQYPSSQPYPVGYIENTPQGQQQQMSEKEIQKQRRKRLREQLKAEKKAQNEFGTTSHMNTNLRSQNMDPRDLEELQRLEEIQQRKAEIKAQKKLERDERRIEQSADPEFVRLMYNVDEQIRDFISDSTMTSYEFEPLPTDARRQLHVIAALYCLQSKSSGNPSSRHTVITKTSDTYLPEHRQKIERFIFGIQTNMKDQSRIISKNRAKEKPVKEVAAGALPLNEDNVGHRMLSAMGWKQGDSLGTGNDGIVAPVKAVIRKNRKGLGS